MNRIIAIIPARSGSKGLKDKNIKELNKKPMIAYTIEAAKKSGIFKDIIVSTDSREYAEIAIKYGADAPFLRSKELSNDAASSIDVIIDVLSEMKKLGKEYNYFMLLQPTSPLRTSQNIKEAYELLVEKEANAVVSVCETEHSPLLANTLDENLSLDNFLDEAKNMRRQDLTFFYRVNGAIYISKVRYFLKFKDFYKEKSFAYIMDKRESIDIDNYIDFKLAEVLLKEKKAF
ncbi:pseudaminic acid cytidylyltransferase [Orenia marismortui]|uniref:pseudaminic acid cytidylyltransferase n=1 Tax=Orenia marismortui TaxID=46469 RepID=UPI00036DBD13|nr:pseudaminic acid cytidylyltransferase [Orenia marismortui]